MSPAQIVFGKNLRDLQLVAPGMQVFTSPAVHPIWRQTWKQQEEALHLRFAKQVDNLQCNTRLQSPLTPGDRVLLQNETELAKTNHSTPLPSTHPQIIQKTGGTAKTEYSTLSSQGRGPDLTTAPGSSWPQARM
ncbi:hypothetical protein SK128_015743 [Halocaridina rubra]|uniref:Uncharacterized protein n=1 Tax=Halocaridina rubra TaxID=373956 RepID=A0AAN9AH29_HALRR